MSTYQRFFVFVLLVVIIVISPARMRAQDWSLGWIIFSSESGADEWHLFRMLSDGTNILPITQTNEEFNRVSFLSLSPDREWILFSPVVFTLQGIWRERDIYRVRLNGTEMQRMTEGQFHPQVMTWSLDGAWFYFTSCLQVESSLSNCGLYRQNINGNDLQRLVEEQVWVLPSPAWSLDGEWLYYQTKTDFYRMRGDGSDIQNLTNTPLDGEEFQSWSPDREWIYFSINLQDLYRIPADGGALQDVLTDTGRAQSIEAWTPDGEWMIGQDYYQGSTGAYRMRSDGNEREFLTPPRSHITAISPDYLWLYYEDEVLRPHRVNIEDRQDEAILSGFEIAGPITWTLDGRWMVVWADSGVYKANWDGDNINLVAMIPRFSKFHTWSPDGLWMIYEGGGRLYRMNIDNGFVEQLTEDLSIFITTTWGP